MENISTGIAVFLASLGIMMLLKMESPIKRIIKRKIDAIKITRMQKKILKGKHR